MQKHRGIKLYFMGANQQVTGSRYCLDTGNSRVMVDCGMFQERQYTNRNWRQCPLAAESLHALLVTHAPHRSLRLDSTIGTRRFPLADLRHGPHGRSTGDHVARRSPHPGRRLGVQAASDTRKKGVRHPTRSSLCLMTAMWIRPCR